MSRSDRSKRLRRCLLAFALMTGFIGGFMHAADSTATTATPEGNSAPMAEATVDGVSIRLMSWADIDSWQGVIEATNTNAFPVSITASLVQLESTLPNGTFVVSLPRASEPESCDLAPGATGQLKLDFAFEPGQSGNNLTIGLSEPDRTGAKVIFPLNSNNGASAIGGTANAGGNASSGTASASPSPAAGAGNLATPTNEPAATPANVCTY